MGLILLGWLLFVVFVCLLFFVFFWGGVEAYTHI